MIYAVAIIAGIAGILFGFDEGVIAGALHLLRNQFVISPFSEGLMTAAVPLGALFGALVAGPTSLRYGRRGMLLFAGGLFVLGAVLASAITAIWMLTLARLVLGFAVGIAAMVAPLYIAESAPTERRGMLISVYQLAITLGILSAYVVNFALGEGWRLMFLLGAIPGVALLVGMSFLRDTPRWLMLKGRRDEAREALARLRGRDPGDPRVTQELDAIASAAKQDEKPAQWSDLLSPMVRPALVVAVGLFLLQQLSGINAVIYYAPTVFQEAGFDSTSTQILATIGVGVVNVLMTIVGMLLIDRIGRRRLLMIGFVGTALGLSLIAVGALTGAQSLDVLAVIGLMVYIAAFAVSLGALPWVMMAEVFPLHLRGLAMSLTSVVNWGFNFLVVMSFPMLVAGLGLGGVFAIYALVCVIGILFTITRVPETSGVSLEAIERHLRSGLPFHRLRPEPEVFRELPDLSATQVSALVAQLVQIGPCSAELKPHLPDLGRIAHRNRAVYQALQRVAVRSAFPEGGRLRRGDLGNDRAVLFAFLEHVRYASPEFLESMGEWPVGGSRES